MDRRQPAPCLTALADSVPQAACVHVCLSVCACGRTRVPPSSPVTSDCCVSWTEGEVIRSAFSACPLSFPSSLPATLAQDLLPSCPPAYVSTEPLGACVRRAGSQARQGPAEQASPLPGPEAWPRLCCSHLPLGQVSCGGLDLALGSQASEHFGGPPSLWQVKRAKGRGRRPSSVPPPSLPPALLSTHWRQERGLRAEGSLGLLFCWPVPHPQPGSGSVNPKLRSHLLPWAMLTHAASISPGGAEEWGHAPPTWI